MEFNQLVEIQRRLNREKLMSNQFNNVFKTLNALTKRYSLVIDVLNDHAIQYDLALKTLDALTGQYKLSLSMLKILTRRVNLLKNILTQILVHIEPDFAEIDAEIPEKNEEKKFEILKLGYEGYFG